MINKLIALFFVLLSQNVFAYNFPVEISEYMDNGKVDAYINKSDVNDESKWSPFEASVPLSVNDAINKVKDLLASKKTLTESSIIAIELKQIPHHKNYWHYLLKVESTIGHKRQNHFYVVLMSGKVIAAFKEPDSIK